MQRLKSKKEIDSLFESGFIKKSGGLLLRYYVDDRHKDCCIGVAVSKSKFRKAVDRNRIKRQLRAALSKLNEDALFLGNGMLIYTGDSLPQFEKLVEDCGAVFKKVRYKEGE